MDDKTDSSVQCEDDGDELCQRNETISPLSKSSGEVSSKDVDDLNSSFSLRKQVFREIPKFGSIETFITAENMEKSGSKSNPFMNNFQNSSFPFLHPSQMHALATLMKANSSYLDPSYNSKFYSNPIPDRVPNNNVYPYLTSHFSGQSGNSSLPYFLNAAQYIPGLSNFSTNSFPYRGAMLPGGSFSRESFLGTAINDKVISPYLWGKRGLGKSIDQAPPFNSFPGVFPQSLNSDSSRTPSIKSSRFSPYSISPHFQLSSQTRLSSNLIQKKEPENFLSSRKKKTQRCESVSSEDKTTLVSSNENRQENTISASVNQLRNMENLVSEIDKKSVSAN